MTISPSIRGILLVVLVSPAASHAQTLFSRHSPDSSTHHAVRLYRAAIGSSAGLYNGFQYKEHDIHHYDIGHPYFHSDDWITGTINYEGQYYTDVPMMYDVVNDKVIVENSSGYANLELIRDKVTNFSLDGHDFVKLAGDTTAENSVRPGFYDVLYSGDVKVYARRKKEIERKLEARVYVKTFKKKDVYFIEKAGSYFPVKSKSSVLNVFHDQKSVLKRQLAKDKIIFKRNRELSIARLAMYYDESVRQP